MAAVIQKYENLEGVKLCATCAAFIQGGGSDAWDDVRNDFGDCIRNPPVPVDSDMGPSRMFPVVSGIDRCLKWKDAKRKLLTMAYVNNFGEIEF